MQLKVSQIRGELQLVYNGQLRPIEAHQFERYWVCYLACDNRKSGMGLIIAVFAPNTKKSLA